MSTQSPGMGFQTKQRKKVNKERTTSHQIRGVVVGDALVCIARAVRNMGHTVEEVSTTKMGMFGPVEVPFKHFTTTENVDIPIGSYRVEKVGLISVEAESDEGSKIIPELVVSIMFEQDADPKEWDRFVELLGIEITSHVSLFKKRALRIYSPEDMIVPKYIDVTSPSRLLLNPDVASEIEENLFYPVEHNDRLKEVGIKGQRGILLHGSYGTGKSLIAYEAAKRSTAVGRTFVLCTMKMLSAAIPVSRFLQPSTLFIEDMDELRYGGSGLSQLRNMLSGVENKQGFDVVSVLTTNFIKQVEDTDRSLLRPERIDAIIEITPPTAQTVGRLIKQEAGEWMGLYEVGEWDTACNAIADAHATPAIIVEMVNRAKLKALTLGEESVTLPMLAEAFNKLEHQLEMATPKPPKQGNIATQLSKALYKTVQGYEQEEE